jgi:hypothetical protein
VVTAGAVLQRDAVWCRCGGACFVRSCFVIDLK